MVRSAAFDSFGILDQMLSPQHVGSPHAHGSNYISLVLEGGYRGFHGDQERKAKSGELFFYEAGVPHHAYLDGRSARVIHAELPDGVLIQREREALRKMVRAPGARAGATSLAVRRLFVLFASGAPSRAIELSLRGVIDAVSRETEVAPRAPGWLTRAREIVIRDRAQPSSLARIATELGLSPTNMSRSFHKHFGCTLGEFLRMARVTLAAEELSSSPRPLAEVALRNGFSDQSHMGRLFRLHLGVTPAVYRDLARVS